MLWPKKLSTKRVLVYLALEIHRYHGINDQYIDIVCHKNHQKIVCHKVIRM